MDKRLLKLLLIRQFFLRNSRFITKSMFPNELRALFETIAYSHEKFKKEELTVAELHDLHLIKNPAITWAAKNNIELLLQELSNEPLINEDIADEVLKATYKREIARRAGEIAVNIINGREGNFDDIRRVLDDITSDVSQLDPVPETLEEVLKGAEENTQWKFNIATLRKAVEGVGPGSFSIFAMRPELGKTALWVSLAAGPGGWCEQGATVHAFINEERANRTMLRAWSARTGFTREQLSERTAEAKELYAPIKGKLKLFDCVGITIDELYSRTELDTPDILVIDQLDKVRVDGNFNRGDEKLREIYTRSRELAKAHNFAAIGISQLSAEAQGKAYVDYSMLENSKTGKAAEADLIICGGANALADDDGVRHLNLSKNKISGNHSTIMVKLQQDISRYIE